jgi:hypothetical protein
MASRWVNMGFAGTLNINRLQFGLVWCRFWSMVASQPSLITPQKAQKYECESASTLAAGSSTIVFNLDSSEVDFGRWWHLKMRSQIEMLWTASGSEVFVCSNGTAAW